MQKLIQILKLLNETLSFVTLLICNNYLIKYITL
jgi:hypothetical protein